MDASERRMDLLEADIKRISKKKTVANTTAGQLRKQVDAFDTELESAKSANSEIKRLEITITENTTEHDAHVTAAKQFKTSIDKIRIQITKKSATLDAKLKDIPKKLQKLEVLQAKQEK